MKFQGNISILFVLMLCIAFPGIAQIKTDYPVLRYDQLEQLDISLPYISYYGKDSSLLVYGSNHTANPGDPQVVDIQKKLCDFRPEVVLYEGDGIALAESLNEAVSDYFEMGLVKYLADSLHIPGVNIEPLTADKYQYLMSRFTLEEVMLATLGLQITMMQAADEDFETKYTTLVADLVKEGMPLSPKQQTLAYFHETYQRFFKTAFSYQSFDARDIQAKYNRTVLNKVNQSANEFRDQHIISLVQSLLKADKKVYLQIGGWHAIICEPAFRQITL